MYSETSATNKIKALSKRIRAVQGGTSASKTVSILLYLIARAQSDKTPTITSVVSESFPHLKRGAIRDFLSIMQEHKYFEDERWNQTDYTYTFPLRGPNNTMAAWAGSKIEFFSADQPGKVRGPRRDRLFINEANNIPFETFEQLEVRTKEFIFLDWNPTNEFWFYEELLGKRSDLDHIVLTYKDNEALDPAIVSAIEQRQGRKNWWQVYGLGQLGEVESRIFTGWQLDLEEIPHQARLERYGLDFGYSNDPTALIAVYYLNGGYILDEVLYLKGLSNRQISETILNLKKALVIADSASPKDIDEIRMYGVNIQPTTKGPGSLLQRIQMMQDQQISLTKRSVNLIKEYRNYLWETDIDGRILNEPIAIWNHGMDAAGYALASLVPILRRKEMIDSLPRLYTKPKPNPAL